MLATFALSAAPGVSHADGVNDYLASLRYKAQEHRLAGDRYWDILLHYHRHGSEVKSLIDDPKFFLAAAGKQDPQAELDATLGGFFLPSDAGDDHPRCRFVARYDWLKDRLGIDESLLPPVDCKRFNEAISRINPRSAVLVFPAAHVNSPTTMFGHTLIRIDSAYESDLLSYGISYGAVITDTNGIVYGIKGVFGFYSGYFSIMPYYDKVKEYTHMEHRDMWEYELTLTAPEVRRLTYHVWELEDVASDYYFFDENCAYNLLFLLEAARPSLHLTDRVGSGLRFWVIPSDTVRVVREGGLIEKVKYRPSAAKRIHTMASRMDTAERNVAQDVANGKMMPQQVLDSAESSLGKIKVLDLSADLLQYRASRLAMEKDEYLKAYLSVLKARSSLGTLSDDWAAVPRPTEPEQGHRSGKMGLGFGYTDLSGKLFAELSWRAAYQGLMDPDDGFVEGSEIKFGEVTARYYFPDNSLRLWSVHALDIISLAPRDEFFKPYSWKVNTGLDRILFQDGTERLVYRLNPGRGLAYQGRFGILYLMGELELNASGAFEDNFALGAAASAGVLSKAGDIWKGHLSVRGIVSPLGDPYRSLKGELAQNFKISRNNSVTVNVSREKTWGHYQTVVNAGWNFYY